jgi:hypothetical protein
VFAASILLTPTYLEEVMTVGELIDLLGSFDPDTLVVRGDNSGGYEAIRRPWVGGRVTELLVGKTRQIESVIVE